jgi:hypothetical protein
VAPVITGSAMVGGSLSVSNGAYTPTATSFTYSWLRDGAPIPGATAKTYVPVAADLGKVLTAQVTARSAGGTPVTAVSGPTVPVAPTAAMQIAAKYTSSGGAGGSLGAATSGVAAFANNGGGSLQHFANGSIYSSNLGGTWIVMAGPIRDQYFAANSIFGAFGWPSGAVSCATSCSQSFTGGTISAGPTTVSTPPVITGVARVGGSVSVSNGTYSPTATSFTYRWFRNGSPIAGATGKTYVPVAADLGQVLTAEVTAKSASGMPVAALSAATPAIGPSAAAAIAALAAANPTLGAATTAVVAFPDNGGGALQHYQNGSIYSSNVTGTFVVWAGSIRTQYWAANSIFGTYKWPTGDRACVSGSCSQTFQGGTLTGTG